MARGAPFLTLFPCGSSIAPIPGRQVAIIEALERIDFAPLAVALTEAVGSNIEFTRRIANGWWQGEYVLGGVAWHRTRPQYGTFSNWTSRDFHERYAQAYDGAEVTYHGAANFAAGCTLVDAIERAQSLERDKVVQSLGAWRPPSLPF